MPTMYETATNEIVPAIRSYIAKELVNKHKMSEESVAKLLDVAQAAISKYLNGKYSERVKEIERTLNKDILEKYINEIVEGSKVHLNACICKLCQSVNSFDCA